MTDDEPITYYDEDGRLRLARDWRHYRQRSARISALVRSIFDDARYRNRTGKTR